jgi:hypothetical protein
MGYRCFNEIKPDATDKMRRFNDAQKILDDEDDDESNANEEFTHKEFLFVLHCGHLFSLGNLFL